MSWATLTNRPNNGSQQRYHNNSYNNDNDHSNYNSNRPNTTHRIRTRNNILVQNHNPHYNRNNNYQNYNQYATNKPPRHQNQNKSRVQTTGQRKRHNDINYVILDAGAFIARQGFFNNFDANTHYYMTPGVEQEIRDKQSRQFLERFPYHIEVKEPQPESVQFVNKFIAKHPDLRSMSKTDRSIIALAHTLEMEHEGDRHLNGGSSALTAKHNLPAKAMTVIAGGDTSSSLRPSPNDRKQVKKSKTGRVHSQAVKIDDTGLRLSKLKKVIPFHFDDFMTLTQQQYGAKYGKPTLNVAWIASSPVRSPLKASSKQNQPETADLDAEEKDVDDTKEKKKEPVTASKTDNDKDGKKEKVKYNPNVKAMTACSARESVDHDELDQDLSALSKAARRRLRQKKAKASTSMMTEENLMSFELMEEKELASSDDDLRDQFESIKQEIAKDKAKEKQDLDARSQGGESQKSEIDQMIEEDEKTLFHETASLISSLSEHSSKQLQQYGNRFVAGSGRPHRVGLPAPPANMPQITQSQSLPAYGDATSKEAAADVTFGTLFANTTGAAAGGGAFGHNINATASPGNSNPNNGGTPGAVMGNITHSPLPALSQNETSDHLSYAQIRPDQPAKPEAKVSANEAWNNEWLTPDNFKAAPKNAPKKKTKLTTVQDSKNAHSSVAVITVDVAMQRAMSEMGLRVLSTSEDRQYRGGGDGRSEPVKYQFRCYACFQMEENTTRTHCRWCGGQTFQRVSVFEDDNGKHHYRYSFRDRYGHKYLDRHSLVPRGTQLVKYNQKNGRNQSNQSMMNQKKKKKRRGYLSQPGDGNFRGGGQRW